MSERICPACGLVFLARSDGIVLTCDDCRQEKERDYPGYVAHVDRHPENIALLDMDGTVCRMKEALDRDVTAVLQGQPVSPEVLDRIEALIKRQPGWWRTLEPIGLGLAIAETLAHLGFRITVLTKGPKRAKNAWTEKFEWCEKYLPYANVTVTQDKSLVYGKILVDDYPEYMLGWLSRRPRGIGLMPAQEWNEKFSHPQVYKVDSYQRLQELKPMLVECFQR